MSEAKYWGEYDAAKKAALKMAAKLSAKEIGLMVRALHCDMKDEAEHDETRQGAFEQTMLSLDRPDEDGNLYDYGDCGRAVMKASPLSGGGRFSVRLTNKQPTERNQP